MKPYTWEEKLELARKYHPEEGKIVGEIDQATGEYITYPEPRAIRIHSSYRSAVLRRWHRLQNCPMVVEDAASIRSEVSPENELARSR